MATVTLARVLEAVGGISPVVFFLLAIFMQLAKNGKRKDGGA